MKYLMGLVFSLKVAGLFSQCTFSVSNIKGTKTVGGIQVTVTSSGMVDSNATYCNATLPYIETIASMGVIKAASKDPLIASGINVKKGAITHPAVAEAFGMRWKKWNKV